MINPTEVPRLFHVSDLADIRRFEPRASRTGEALVWAIGEAKLANYLLPRDCPRVTFYADQNTSDTDRIRFLGSSKAVIAIESTWFRRCMEAKLFLYEFNPQNFRLQDAVACYYVSPEIEYPIRNTPIDQVLETLLETGIELRIMPSLWQLREAVIDSTLAFSINRFRNALAAPEGFSSKYPVPGLK